ncbi:flavin monoamine oxidase family protein [Mycobacterium sp. 48b]|uniref:flavin monoamine oxidase family protein n=1 Tax=Mycobacterium sp. 48b TaxID=3400426 RepID=UPI003AAC8B8D
MTIEYDTIVIGAGIAGLTAARDLADRGNSVVVLEGGRRIGGRTYARPFAARPDLTVDFGGSWVNRKLQPNMNREIRRYGITLKEDPPTESASFYTGGSRRIMPVPSEELGDLERALSHVRDASKRIVPNQSLTSQTLRDLDVTFEQFFAPLDLPEATRDAVLAMTAAYSGSDPNEISMLNLIGQVTAYGHSPYGFVSALTERFVGGAATLLNAMIDGSRLEVRLDHRVVRVEQNADHVTVRTAGGVSVTARTCIVAAPTNVLRHIEFTPQLSAAKQRATAVNHPSRAFKSVALVRNLHSRPYALGTADMQMVCHAYDLGDGSHILYGFGSANVGELDYFDREQVETVLRLYFPNIEVVAVDAHDWNADPLFDGTYRFDRAGEYYDTVIAMNTPEDRIVFAGTDIDDSLWRSWMEGAVNSAHQAADITGASLVRTAAGR